MGRELQTFLDYLPLKRGASFNLDTLKAEKMAQAEAASKGTGQ
jgi:arylsulfatase